MRMILCQIDDLGETFTFSECNFQGQSPPNYQTAPLFVTQPQASSIEGAKQMLGEIANNTNINGV